jgi:hypothetical protein
VTAIDSELIAAVVVPHHSVSVVSSAPVEEQETRLALGVLWNVTPVAVGGVDVETVTDEPDRYVTTHKMTTSG